MSDLVDDLHYAEDVIGGARVSLERAAVEVHRFHARGSFEDCRKEACVHLRDEIAAVAGYCRTSCEQDDNGVWLCGDDCGCPGEHRSPHGEEIAS